MGYGHSEWKMRLIVQNKLGSLFYVKKKEKHTQNEGNV